MRTVITYGTFDLLHEGHLRLLERAKALGDRLIVGVTSDRFDRERGKLNVSQTTLERVDALRKTGIADEIVIEEYEGQKIEDVRRLNVDVFAVGSDWVGHFDYLREWCDVVYLPRTEGISSSAERAQSRRLRMALVGDAQFAYKVLDEARYVDGLEIIDARSTSLESILPEVNAVMLLSHPSLRLAQAREALKAGVHVLCELPAAMSATDELGLFSLARESGLVFVDTCKTACSEAYEQLLHLVKGGAIGKVVSVDATCTSLRARDSKAGWSSLYEWGHLALLPALQLLGTSYEDVRVWSFENESSANWDLFTKVDLTFPTAVASAKVGVGTKSEGELVVTGTQGYAYVPAPWWKSGYFELRYEDPANNRRYFFPFEGEGIRYELASFARAVERAGEDPHVDADVAAAIADIFGEFHAHRVVSKPWKERVLS